MAAGTFKGISEMIAKTILKYFPINLSKKSRKEQRKKIGNFYRHAETISKKTATRIPKSITGKTQNIV